MSPQQSAERSGRPLPLVQVLAEDGRHRTVCRMCHGGCGAVVTVEGGRLTAIEGDQENPNNRGFLCAKGRASLEQLHHPDRLTTPLLRTGARGSGRFRPIGWPEALDRIAAALDKARQDGGPESVVFAQGTDRNYQEWLFRFANSFGSPNVLGPAHVCFYPRVMAGILTLGGFTFCDYEGGPDLVLVWGSNKALTHGDGVIGTRLLAAVREGTRMIVVDPRRTSLAARAERFLQVRPGEDAALALAMIHTVIEAGAYDHAFVAAHTVGFEDLAAHVADYPPEAVEERTGIPAEQIRAAALAYAAAPSAAIELGTGPQQHRDSFHTCRALLLLSAICGNIDRPGGDVLWDPPGIDGRRSFPRAELLPKEQAAKRLGGDRHRILAMSGWAHPGSVWDAVLEPDAPHPVSTMLVHGSNLLLNYADSDRVRRALERLDFLAVVDLRMTPTAAMADVVLPVGGWLERDQIVEHAHYVAARRAFARVGDSRSDEWILTELAHRLGLSADFWPDARESLDTRLEPIGMDWRQLAELHYRATPLEYHKYRTRGFGTRSGKVGLRCDALRVFGYPPLPVAGPPVGTPQDGRYLLTSAHSPFYFNSEFRDLPSLRSKEPEPRLDIHPDAAAREGLADGDWAEVATRTGRIRLRVRLTDRIAPDVVVAPAAWWYPERGPEGGWRDSNVNLLTSNENENPEMGSSTFRGLRCEVRAAP
ncbi:molybdopterin-containing oxidoreductase family protein [Kitasatospora brasiliensis]|uniref:molybdopterin-containing oxidoreductase family protein n=1 Tax=Kitasatospora brasiliensis TaxID=3058040 RepID=UPI00292D3886|nr:molybdopterin-dependent oxidoreductase [Kitasatospora sp. K002]